MQSASALSESREQATAWGGDLGLRRVATRPFLEASLGAGEASVGASGERVPREAPSVTLTRDGVSSADEVGGAGLMQRSGARGPN